MDYSRLKYLANLQCDQKNKHDLNKEEQKEYATELFQVLKEQGLTAESEYYTLSMANWGGLKGFVSWYWILPSEDKVKPINVLVSSKKMKSLPNNQRMKITLYLLASAMSDDSPSDNAIECLLQWLVELSYKKDGSRINDLGKIFRTYFLNVLGSHIYFPEFVKFEFTEQYITDLLRLFEESLYTMPVNNDKENEKRNKIAIWIKKNQATIKQKKEEEVINTIDNQAPVQMEQEISQPHTTDNIKKETLKVSEQIMEIALSVNQIESQLEEAQAIVSEKEKQIKSLKKEINTLSIAKRDLEKEKNTLHDNLEETQKKLGENIEKNKLLEDRISRQASVLDVFQEDKQNSQSQQLNAIAASLVKFYKDYKEAQTMEINTELEMSLLDLIDAIFKRLEKNGVDVKGRIG